MGMDLSQKFGILHNHAGITSNNILSVTVRSDLERITPLAPAPYINVIWRRGVRMLVYNRRHPNLNLKSTAVFASLKI